MVFYGRFSSQLHIIEAGKGESPNSPICNRERMRLIILRPKALLPLSTSSLCRLCLRQAAASRHLLQPVVAPHPHHLSFASTTTQQEDEEMLVPHSDLVEGPQPLVEGPQPMEVAPVENVGTLENQASDEPQTSRFTWTIENFSRLNTKKLYSDVFVVGSFKWRVLIFPKGNNVDYLSMYLDVADSATLPYGWNRYAQFSLSIVNQMHNKLTIKKDTQHQFNQRESDWGFTSFMPLSELYDANKGYLMNDTTSFNVE